MIIVYGCNNAWYKHLIINIFSLLKYNKTVKKIYILCEDNKIENLDKIKKLYNVDIKTISIEETINKYFKNQKNTNTKYTDFAYAKLLIPEVIKEEKVLYLDTDTIIKSDIQNLWNTNIDDYYAAGVKDYGGHLNKHKEELGINDKYINTGVLLLNNKKIREDNLIPKYFDIINSEDLLYPDQDAFNKVCTNKLLYIPSMYNFAINNMFPVTKFVYDSKLRKIIHYTGDKSDWVADKLFSEEWYEEEDDFYKTLFKNNDKNINIAYCCNRKLYRYLPINIYSLLKYNDRIKKIYLIIEDDSTSDIPYLKEVLNKYKVEIEIVNFTKYQFKYLSKDCKNLDTLFSNFCFAKLLLSELTKEDKIIYLDMDTIVKKDLSLLWELELGDNYALGTKDYGVLDKNNHYGKLNTNCKYINTGVMVLNLKKIRETNLVKDLFDYINSNELVYPDQDAFNIICDSKIKYISSMYNCAFGVTKQIISIDKAVIFHFLGEKEYWVTDKNHAEEYYEEYYQFCKEFNIDNYPLY